MKLGLVVKAGLLVGAVASSVSAQSLTGSVGGNAMVNNGTNGIVSGPTCDIGGVPAQMPPGTQCTFANSGTAAFGASLNVTAYANQYFDISTNTWNYVVNYAFNGTSGGASTNYQFAIATPLFSRNYATASSNASVTLTIPYKGQSTFQDGAPVGPTINVQSFYNANPLGSFGLSLAPTVTVNRTTSGPAVTATATASSGVQPVNQWINNNTVSVGFDIVNTNDPSYFSGTGSVIFQSSAVPEPSTYALFGAGLVALAVAARRRRSV